MARPSQYGEPATETIRVRVTPGQKLAIERAAVVNHTDVAGVIREAVNEYVADCGRPACFAVQNPNPSAQ